MANSRSWPFLLNMENITFNPNFYILKVFSFINFRADILTADFGLKPISHELSEEIARALKRRDETRPGHGRLVNDLFSGEAEEFKPLLERYAEESGFDIAFSDKYSVMHRAFEEELILKTGIVCGWADRLFPIGSRKISKPINIFINFLVGNNKGSLHDREKYEVSVSLNKVSKISRATILHELLHVLLRENVEDLGIGVNYSLKVGTDYSVDKSRTIIDEYAVRAMVAYYIKEDLGKEWLENYIKSEIVEGFTLMERFYESLEIILDSSSRRLDKGTYREVVQRALGC